MATGITIDTQVVLSGANQMQNLKGTLKNLIETANGIFQGLSGWEGQAADTYRATFMTMKAQLDEADGVIGEYITFLNTAVQEYDQTESINTTDDQSFKGGQ